MVFNIFVIGMNQKTNIKRFIIIHALCLIKWMTLSKLWKNHDTFSRKNQTKFFSY